MFPFLSHAFIFSCPHQPLVRDFVAGPPSFHLILGTTDLAVLLFFFPRNARTIFTNRLPPFHPWPDSSFLLKVTLISLFPPPEKAIGIYDPTPPPPPPHAKAVSC